MVAPEARLADVAYLEVPCKSALNKVEGMPFRWSLNPYMGCEHRCAFCYVRSFELRADRAADDRYGRSIRVKVNVAEVLDRELRRASWQHETVAVGTATDPYQPAEGRYRLTRKSLEVLGRHANPAGIITRGPMIVRDIDVLQDLAGVADVSVNFSIPTVDTEVWRRTEPGTAHPRQRLRAVERLVAAGIKAGVAMAPILPGLSDRPEQLAEVVKAAREAGATHLWGRVLYLQPGTREHFLEVLARYWPEQLPRYRALYGSRAYLPDRATEATTKLVAELRAGHGIADRRLPETRRAAPPPPSQLALALS